MPSKEEIEAIGRIKYNDIAKPLYCGDLTICNIEDLEIVINLVERQQKELEQLEAEKKNAIEAYKSEKNMKNTYVSLYQDILLKENVIPKQLIKEKIKKYQKLKEDIEAEGYDADYTEGKIDVLQEIMKGEKNE